MELGKVNREAVRRADGEEIAHRAVFGVTKRTVGLYRLPRGRVLTESGCLPCNYLCLELMDLYTPNWVAQRGKLPSIILSSQEKKVLFYKHIQPHLTSLPQKS